MIVPTSVVVTGHCRLTIATGRSRVDVTAPETVPIAELITDIAHLAGVPLSADAAPIALSRLGEPPLRPERSLAEQGVREGEILYLVSQTAPPPPAVVDDTVSLVAATVDARPGDWTAASARRSLLVAACGLTALGLMPLLVDSRSAVPTGAASLAVAVALWAVSIPLGRQRRTAVGREVGRAVALASLPYWVAGPTVLAFGAGAATGVVLAAATAGLLGGAVAVGVAARPLLSAAVAVVVAAITVGLTALGVAETGASLAAASAGVAVVWTALVVVVPALVARGVGLIRTATAAERDPASGPLLPGTVADQRRRVELGHRLVSGVLSGGAVAQSAAVVVLALLGGGYAWALAGLVGLVVVLRARTLRFVGEVLPLALVAVAAVAGLEARLALSLAGGRPWLIVVPVLTGLVAIAAGLLAGAPSSPTVSTRLDRLEGVAAAALIPVALGAMGVYGAVSDASLRLH